MSARREARAKVPLQVRMSKPGAVPAVLLIGRCVEVWSLANRSPAQFSAMRRFNTARDFWAATQGLDAVEKQELVRNGSPWSVEHLCANGRADYAREKLKLAGCTLSDLPELRAEAQALFDLATPLTHVRKQVHA